MNDPHPSPSTRKPASGSASSRKLAMVAVLVLIVIAVGGILLAGRRPAADPAPAAAPASAPVVAQAASVPASAAGRVDEPPVEVVFPSGSDRPPPSAAATVAHWVEQARVNDKKLRITARFLTGVNKQRDLALAKARTTALHHAAMSNGLTGDKLQVELVELPEGGLQPGEGERVRFSLL